GPVGVTDGREANELTLVWGGRDQEVVHFGRPPRPLERGRAEPSRPSRVERQMMSPSKPLILKHRGAAVERPHRVDEGRAGPANDRHLGVVERGVLPFRPMTGTTDV